MTGYAARPAAIVTNSTVIATKTDVRMLPRLRNRLEVTAPTVKATPDAAMAIDTSKIELPTRRRPESSGTGGMLLVTAGMKSELDQSREHPHPE
jgi:hypothetical protein